MQTTHPMEELINSAAQNPEQPLRAVQILSEEEKHLLLHTFNDTQADYPHDKTLAQLFEEQAEKTPDNIAVIFEDKELTYKELNEAANRLAHSLRERFDIQPDDLIALQLERSEWMIVAILGVLKSGAAYLPIAPDYPKTRVEFMLRDSRAKALLTEGQTLETALRFDALLPVLSVESLTGGIVDNPEPINPDSCRGSHLAYNIYTSGSTGQPKGVQVEHRGLVNAALFHIHWLGITPTDRILQFAPYTFDASAMEVFRTLLSGAALVLVSKEVLLDPPALLALMQKHRVSLAACTPAYLADLEVEKLQDLRILITGAEKPNLAQALRLNKKLRYVNGYGPTEYSVTTSLFELPKDWSQPFIPIGKPIFNTSAFILDEHRQLLPPGATGELCLSGAGLARGYLNDPELTAEKFIEHPFPEYSGQRLYRTGDIARWLPDGNLEFLGRLDHQLKIRGFRIEAGEIEQAILAHPAVQSCVVVGLDFESGKELVAYLVAKSGEQMPDISALRSFLSATPEGSGLALPEYMLPAHFVEMASLPLTSSGKINRKALPAPETSTLATGTAYLAPRNAIERQLTDLWQLVLGRENIGVHDNFFHLGGHSLRAIRMLSLLQKQLSVEVKLAEIFARPTIAAMSQSVAELAHLHPIVLLPIPKIEEQESYPLSNAQRRLWVLAQMGDEALVAYNLPAAIRLRGDLDKAALEQAFHLLFERHEILRTRFVSIEGEGRQVVDSPEAKAFDLSVRDCTSCSEEEIAGLAQAHARHIFDLENERLLQVELLQTGEREHLLLFNLHHIISDGWSSGVLLREWSELYAACATGQAEPLSLLPALPIQYKDYAAWQNALLEDKNVVEHLRGYWREQLANLPALDLPADFVRPPVKTYNGASLHKRFPKEWSERLLSLAQAQSATLFMALTAWVNALLYRYTSQADIVLGVPSAGRNHPDLHGQIGFYVNTLALRSQVEGMESFESLLGQVKATALAAFEHELYPFDRLVEELDLPRDMSRSAVFDVMLVLQNNEQATWQLGDLDISHERVGTGASKFDLTFAFTETATTTTPTDAGGLALEIEYNTDLFRPERIERMFAHLETLLQSILEQPQEQVDRLNMLPEAERRQLLHTFNDTEADFPHDKTIAQLFEEQVERTPDNIAVVFEEKELTYRELNQAANRVAHFLRNNFQIQPDDIVALQLERSEWMIVAILGVLKSGAAYLPLAPDFPRARVEFMLRDSRAKALLTDAWTTAMDFGAMLPVLPMEMLQQGNEENSGNPACINGSQDLAYVIYTSGSTGQPKGVMIEHRALCNFLSGMQKQPGIHAGDTLLASTTYTFDISMLELLLPLVSGAKALLVNSQAGKDTFELQRILQQKRPTMMQATPALWQLLLQSGWTADPAMKVLCGGEALNEQLAQRLAESCQELWNMYGPTETTIWSSIVKLEKGFPSVSIGKGVQNTGLYVLNGNLACQPIGITGELLIGGEGLARGYLNNPELTAEKFIEHPFKPGERLYRTGDLARWLPDGNIEFLGRIDHQLKIRGYRIEAGEIEQAILAHPALQSCVVVGLDFDSGKELVAYLVVKTGEQLPDVATLRNFLSETLPDYMLPAHFVELTSLPLTSSGKVNRKALPAPDASALATGTTYAVPRNAIERQLADIWQQVLGKTGIGIHDNFFHLGGHSLRAIQLLSLLQQQLAVELKLTEVFARPTIAALAQKVAELAHLHPIVLLPIPKIEQQENYPMSNAQRRLWVLAQMGDETLTAYNMPAAIRLRGELDKTALEQAFRLLVERHEILRTRFVNPDSYRDEGEGRQVVDSPEANVFELPFRDCRQNSEQEITGLARAHANRAFDLEKQALLQVELLQTGEHEHLLLFNMHHIISDGWSMEILLREWSQLYEACTGSGESRNDKLPALPIQYKDFAAWQNALLQEETTVGHLRSYWKEQLADLPTLDLPADFPRPAVKTYHGARAQKLISPQLSEGFKALSQSQGATLFMSLAALVKTLLYRYTGQSDLVIGTPSAGRNHPDLHDQLGFYVNTLVLRSQVEGGESFEQLLQKVKATALAAFEHELYPFDRLVEELDLPRDMSRSAVFDVMLVFQNNERTEWRLGEVDLQIQPVERSISKFDLTFGFADTPQGLALDVEYNTDLFRADRMERLAAYLETLLQSILRQPEQPIERLEILPKEEKHLLLHDFNQTAADYPKDKTIAQLFEEQAEKTPGNVAVIFEDKELTYKELNEAANRLAHCLRDRFDIQPDDVIALQLERSEWMVIAILGVLKSGAAYLPIAPDAPTARVKFMLRDSAAKALLADETTLPAAQKSEEVLPVLAVENLQAGRTDNPAVINASQDLAYIIYTSGSTGQPKGVMIEHRGVVNMVCDQRAQFEISPTDRVLQFADYTFDTSVSETWVSLTAGAALVIAPKATLLSPNLFAGLLHRERVTVADLPPAFLATLDQSILATVRLLITGGEAIHPTTLRRYSAIRQYINGYGPTEATVTACTFEATQTGEVLGDNIPIGRPIVNVEVVILDKNLALLPIGIPGELCISGFGLARGYLNNPELTAQKFIDHPFPEYSGQRLYRTGDLARWLPDGNLEFLGRLDHQLKIRGYRIEAGEIEQALLAHPAVQACVVVGLDFEAGKELVAYLVPKQEAVLPDVSDLRAFLSETPEGSEQALPDYMLPAHFVELERLPLTSSGKVDRKALPAPDSSTLAIGTAYAAPRNERERLLAGIWQQVLRRDAIGIHDNFFHAGGDSIKAIQITSRLGTAGWQLSIKDLFAQPTIAGLAGRLERKKRSYDQRPFSGEVPLTAIQHWFFSEQTIDPHHFNQAMLLEWSGEADALALQISLDALVRQHDMLRAVYQFEDGNAIQTVLEQLGVPLQVEMLPATNAADFIEAKATQAQASFDLGAGSLIKAVLFKNEKGQPDQLLLAIHHLVVDGVSWRILLEDLDMAYRQAASGKAIRLPEKTASFALWSNGIQQHARQKIAEKERQYWHSALEKSALAQSLPLAHPASDNRAGDSRELSFELSEEQTAALLHQTHQAYHTEINDVLLTALSRALHRTFGEKKYCLTLEGHGREDLLDLDTSRTVGWFTSTFPFTLAHESDPGRHLQQVKEALRHVPNKGIGFGLLRYLGGEKLEDVSAISFNYLGDFGQGRQEQGVENLFRFSNYSSGQSVSPRAQRAHELDVSGIRLENRLRLSLRYGAKRMEAGQVESLAANFQAALLELVAHCRAVSLPKFTPSDFTGCDMSLEEYEQFLAHHDLDASAIEDIYPLSPMQEGMLFHWMLNPASAAYSVQLELGLGRGLDGGRLRAAWQQLIHRHPILRTAFFSENTGEQQRPLQVVFQAGRCGDPAFQTIDLGGLDAEAQQERIEAYREADRKAGFDLARLPLMRFALFSLGDGRYRLLTSNHHILEDGWSLGVLLKELLEVYRTGSSGSLPPVTPYSSYIGWLAGQDPEKAEGFWRNCLEGYESEPLIPDLKRLDKSAGVVPREHHFNLDEEQSRQLEHLAARYQVSLNTVVQTLWAVLLGRYNQKQDVVFGMTTSGRSAGVEGMEQMVGLFINTVPVRIQWEQGQTFADLLGQVQQGALETQAHEHFPLVQIQSLVQGEGDLFDHIVVFENYPVDEKLRRQQSSGLIIEDAKGFEAVHYGMGLVVHPGAALGLKLTWDEQAWSEDWALRLEGHLRQAVQSVLSEPELPVHQIDILPQAERHLLLHDFNQTEADYPKDQTIAQLFEEQAEKTPGNIAVIFEDKELTYKELNEAANQVAHYLRDNFHIQPDNVIALQLERSEWMVVAILGVLKAGAAYLPLATDAPKSRLEFMLRDSAAKALLTDEITLPAVRNLEEMLPVLAVENLQAERLDNPAVINRSQDLAYIIYTSGSTGMPKGVLIEHRGAVNISLYQVQQFDLCPADQVLLFMAYTFDVSVSELFMALLSGATLVLASETDVHAPNRLMRLLESRRISVATFPAAYLTSLDEEKLQRLRLLITGGEKPVLEQVQSLGKHLRYVNAYGPTECSVCVSTFEVPKNWDKPFVPIGKPIFNTEVLILDAARQLVPLGTAGELCVSGDGLARGYLNNPELTAEKFIAHPFKPGERLYRTGDLARWLPDGDIEFLGRLDHQLKIRGYRIEAGEVEQALLAHPAVQACVVLGLDFEAGKELAAYLVPKAEAALPGVPELRAFLAETLPDYMLPAHFVELPALPLTTSGKVDRIALPSPDTSTLGPGTDYVAPRNERERLLAGIWRQTLRVNDSNSIGIHDNFFHWGGDSIKAIQITARLAMAGWQLAIKDLFAQPTIAGQAQRMGRKIRSYDQGTLTGQVLLGPAQQGYLSRRKRNQDPLVIPDLLEWQGKVNLLALQQSLAAIMQHHDMLRASYSIEAGQVVQTVLERAEAELRLEVLPASEQGLAGDAAAAAAFIEKTEKQVQQSFDLKAGGMLKAVLFKNEQEPFAPDNDCNNAPSLTAHRSPLTPLKQNDRLLLVCHHLVTDAVSSGILLEDLAAAYRQAETGKTIRLPEKTASFALWAKSIRQDAEQGGETERQYWREMVEKCRQAAALPIDCPEVEKLRKDLRNTSFELTKEQTAALLHQTNRAYQTETYEVLLTAFSRALRAAFGGKSYPLAMRRNGRDAIGDLDVSRTMGWFNFIFPFVLEYEDDPGSHLQHVREALRSIPRKGHFYDLLSAGRSEHDDGTIEYHPNIGFNFIGTARQPWQDMDELFKLVELNDFDPDNNSQAKAWRDLILGGFVKQDRLSLSIRYNEKRMEAGRMEALAQHFKDALLELVGHCAMVATPTLTPPEFTAAALPSGVLLTQGTLPTLFAFPPSLGLGVFFYPLAFLLDNFPVYAFDFEPDGDRLEKYYREIKAQQAQGPYLLMGYSTSLAFEVAQYLEVKGEVVDHLVLVDSMANTVERQLSEAEIEAAAQDLVRFIYASPHLLSLKEQLHDDESRRQLQGRASACLRHQSEQVTGGKTAASIHLLLADDNPGAADVRLQWGEFTTANFLVHPGKGEHQAMLLPPHLEANAALVNNILRQIEAERQEKAKGEASHFANGHALATGAETAAALPLDKLPTGQDEQNGSRPDSNPVQFHKHFSQEVEVLESHRQQPAEEQELDLLRSENRVLHVQVLQLQQELETTLNEVDKG